MEIFFLFKDNRRGTACRNRADAAERLAAPAHFSFSIFFEKYSMFVEGCDIQSEARTGPDAFS